MKKLRSIVPNILLAIGAILIYGGVSSSDYYVIELGQPEPAHVWPMIWIGIGCALPKFIHLILKECKYDHGS